MYCLPLKAEKCPITHISFFLDEADKVSIETSDDPIHGLPIIDLKLS